MENPSKEPSIKTYQTPDTQRSHEPQPEEPQPTGTPPTPRTYLERIPVAGLYNYLYAESGSLERNFWFLVLLLATSVTLMYTIPAITTYLEFTTVIEVRHPSQPKLPFPIFYVGLSDGVNGTYFLDRFAEITPQLLADRRMQKMARSIGMDVPSLIWYTIQYITVGPFWDLSWINTEWIPLVHEVVYRSILAYGANWTGIGSFYEEGMYNCRDVLKNCELNGIDFPCCHDNVNGYSDDIKIFYKMNVRIFAPKSAKLYFTAVKYGCFSDKLNLQ